MSTLSVATTAILAAIAGAGIFVARRRAAQREAAWQDAPQEAAPAHVQLADGSSFDVAGHLAVANGVPLLDWEAAEAAADEDATVLAALRRAWLLHLRDALGPHFRLRESDEAIVVSSLDHGTTDAILRFVATTRARLVRLLQDVAGFAPGEKSIVVVTDDEDSYYRYIANHYAEDGEFGFSGGVFLAQGCPHFVVKRGEFRTLEPVIAHEMTHSALAHLDLPLWIDEGLAVNTEHRLVGTSARTHTAHELHAKHLAFWNAERIQEFWSGRSFHRSDDGQMLSYELARILVRELSRDWASFAAFARAAEREDAGQAAAERVLGVDLVASVCAIFGKTPDAGWVPDPARWQGAPA